MHSENEIVVIYSTVPPDVSGSIADKLVRSRAAACVNIMPVRSVYTWKEEHCRSDEHRLIIKTVRAKAGQLIDQLASIHPYEVPEIIVLPVVAGYKPYLEWVSEVTDPARCLPPICGREPPTE